MAARPASEQRPGRQRDPGNDVLILDATLRLLARYGYSRMSLRAVAEEAGVSSATVHLRWPTKVDLATAAMERERLLDLPVATGDTRADLVAQLRWYEHTAERFSSMGLVGACLAEERTTPELLRLLRERAALPRLRSLEGVLEQARERGKIAADADVESAARLLFGAFYGEHIPGEAPGDLVERTVELVLRSLGG